MLCSGQIILLLMLLFRCLELQSVNAGIGSLQTSHKDENNPIAAQESRREVNAGTGHGGGQEGGEGGNGREMSPHEVAVRAALQAGAADESQRETFTQLEEKAVTIETTERFLEHRYYQREYIILVSILRHGMGEWRIGCSAFSETGEL